MSFSKRAFSALSVAIMRSREERTLGATPSRRFFSACSMRESSSRRRTKACSCATSRVGGCHGAGFRAQTKSAIMAASSRSVLFRLPALRAYCLTRRGLSKLTRWPCAMEPQRKGMAVGSGGFQACPNLWHVVLFEDAGQLSKALGIVSKAKSHCCCRRAVRSSACTLFLATSKPSTGQ